MPLMKQLQYYNNVITTGTTCEAELMLPIVALVGMVGDDEDAKR